MSTIMMVSCLVLLISSFTILSRQNLRRKSRQRKINLVLEKVRNIAE